MPAKLVALEEAGIAWIELDGWRYDADPEGTLAALRRHPQMRVGTAARPRRCIREPPSATRRRA